MEIERKLPNGKKNKSVFGERKKNAEKIEIRDFFAGFIPASWVPCCERILKPKVGCHVVEEP